MSGKEKTNGSLAMAPRVITIPAANQETARKLRVAAYTRVSSNSKDQEHSFAAQNAYFSKLITDNPDWELADIYADQGITGTSIDKRDDFLRMMEDCRKGRIDRILVKSSSRFARNTKESLAAVRELKSLNISVYFEEQNIDTAQVSGEVLIAMFAALAQRESEAIESAATSREEIGNPVYPPVRRKLAEHGISCDGHAARQLTNADYEKYDLLIGMDSANLRNMHCICGGDFAGKLHLLMDYTDHPCDVADPWYTGDFEATWQDVLAGCQGLLREITGHHHTRE